MQSIVRTRIPALWISTALLVGFTLACSPAATADEPAAPSNEYFEALIRQRELVREAREIRKPLLTEEDKAAYTDNAREFRSAVSEGLSGGVNQKILEIGLKYKIFQITEPDVADSPEKSAEAMQEVRRDLNRAGGLINNKDDRERFREDMCRTALGFLRQLLDNRLEARSFAIQLMPDLEVVRADFNNPQSEILTGVDRELAQIISDDNQPDVIRGTAAFAARRFIEAGNPVPQAQLRIIRAAADQLRRPHTSPAYQSDLIDTLAATTVAREVQGQPKPTGLEVLVEVLSDTNRSIQVRCRAAGATGRVGYDSQINFEPLAWKIVELSIETAVITNNTRASAAVRRDCGWNLYTAFHHWTKEEVSGPNTKGYLNRASRSEMVKQAYEKMLPIAASLMGQGGSVPQGLMQDAYGWLTENAPNLQYDSNAAPIRKGGNETGQ